MIEVNFVGLGVWNLALIARVSSPSVEIIGFVFFTQIYLTCQTLIRLLFGFR